MNDLRHDHDTAHSEQLLLFLPTWPGPCPDCGAAQGQFHAAHCPGPHAMRTVIPSEEMLELAKRAVEKKGTQTEQEIIDAGVAFITDTRFGGE